MQQTIPFVFPLNQKVPGTKLVPLELIRLPKNLGGNRAYRCRCDCGNTTVASVSELRFGRHKSCGCGKKERPQNTRFSPEQARGAFLSKVKKMGCDSECWTWAGYKNQDGYGRMMFEGRLQLAHRVSWQIHNGPIPEGMKVLHHCDNPTCVNPSHLFLGTQDDNMKDCAAKGRIVHPNLRGEFHPTSKLTEADVLGIRNRAAMGTSRKLMGMEFGVCRQTIDDIVNRKHWTHL